MLLQAFLYCFHVFLAGFLGGQGHHVFVGFNDGTVNLLGDGKYLLYVTNEFVVLVHVALVLEFKRLEDVDSGELDIRDGISFVNAHGSKIDTLLRSRLWLLLCKAFQASERKKHDEYYYVKPCVHVAKVHHSV